MVLLDLGQDSPKGVLMNQAPTKRPMDRPEIREWAILGGVMSGLAVWFLIAFAPTMISGYEMWPAIGLTVGLIAGVLVGLIVARLTESKLRRIAGHTRQIQD